MFPTDRESYELLNIWTLKLIPRSFHESMAYSGDYFLSPPLSHLPTLPSCHPAIQPSSPATLPPCHPAIQPPCHPAILLPSHPATQPPCQRYRVAGLRSKWQTLSGVTTLSSVTRVCQHSVTKACRLALCQGQRSGGRARVGRQVRQVSRCSEVAGRKRLDGRALASCNHSNPVVHHGGGSSDAERKWRQCRCLCLGSAQGHSLSVSTTLPSFPPTVPPPFHP